MHDYAGAKQSTKCVAAAQQLQGWGGVCLLPSATVATHIAFCNIQLDSVAAYESEVFCDEAWHTANTLSEVSCPYGQGKTFQVLQQVCGFAALASTMLAEVDTSFSMCLHLVKVQVFASVVSPLLLR